MSCGKVNIEKCRHRKRKSISRRLLESFRESRSAEAVFKEDLLNKYVKNRLSEDMFSLNTVTNNSIIPTASKGYNLKLSCGEDINLPPLDLWT